MASLDDFFAKKDKRKKGKSKPTFVTSELLAKTIEEQSAPSTQPAEGENKAKIDLPAAPTQEDEWKEEEELVQDFEGLRVRKLDKGDDGHSAKVPVSTFSVENEEEGDVLMKEGSPWQTVNPTPRQQEPAPQPAADPEPPPPDPVPDQLPNVQKDVYVPPGARGGGGGAREGGAYVPPHLKRGMGGGGAYGRRGGGAWGRGKRVPPDLRSNVAFPSLADVAKRGEGPVERGGGEFKEAQGPKTSRVSEANYRAPSLQLTNKFSVLEDD